MPFPLVHGALRAWLSGNDMDQRDMQVSLIVWARGGVDISAARRGIPVRLGLMLGAAASLPFDPGALRLASDLRRSGIEPSRGQWHHVRRGVWIDAVVWGELDADPEACGVRPRDGPPAPP